MTSVLRSVGVVGVGAVGSRALLFLRDGFLARTLGAAGYGIWVQVIVLLGWMLHLPLGYQNVLSRDVPFLRGRDDASGVRRVQSAALQVTLTTAGLAALTIAAVSMIAGNLTVAVAMVVLISATVVAQQYNGYQSVTLRAHERFVDFSVGVLISAALGLIFSLFLAPHYGVEGAVAAQCLGLLTASIWWQRQMPSGTGRPTLVNKAIRDLLPTAIPLFLGGVLMLLATTIDRLLVVASYSREDVGHYGFAFTLTQAVHLVVTPIVQVMQPRMMLDLGRSNSGAAIVPWTRLYVQLVPVLALMVLGLGTLVAPLLLPILLPEFVPSLGLLRRLVPATAFFILAGGAQGLLVARHKEGLVVVGNGVAVAALATVLSTAIILARPIGTFALLVFAGNAALAVGWTWLAVSRLQLNGAAARRRTIVLLAPVAALAALLELVSWWAVSRESGWLSVLAACAVWGGSSAVVAASVYGEFRAEAQKSASSS